MRLEQFLISLNKSELLESAINFLETLEDDDDVQQVYANLETENYQKEKNL